MKPIALLLIAIAFPAGALAQAWPEPPQPPASQSQPALPEDPAPAPPNPSPMWDRIEHLPRGEKIKFHFAKGRWERCAFAGATDAYLYCGPEEDTDRAPAWQIDRAAISDFKSDHDVRNGRLVFATFVVAGGTWGGFQALHNTRDEGAAVLGGFLGAVIGGIPGVAGSCIAGHCITVSLPPPSPQAYVFSYNVPLRRLPRRSR